MQRCIMLFLKNLKLRQCSSQLLQNMLYYDEGGIGLRTMDSMSMVRLRYTSLLLLGMYCFLVVHIFSKNYRPTSSCT